MSTAKEYCEYVTAEFQGYAYWNLEDSQLFHAIHDTFKDWTQYQWTAINDITWGTIKRCCIPRGIWIDHLTSKSSASEMMVRLVWTKYDANLKDWDLERIRRVEEIYGQVSRGIQLRKQELLVQQAQDPRFIQHPPLRRSYMQQTSVPSPGKLAPTRISNPAPPTSKFRKDCECIPERSTAPALSAQAPLTQATPIQAPLMQAEQVPPAQAPPTQGPPTSAPLATLASIPSAPTPQTPVLPTQAPSTEAPSVQAPPAQAEASPTQAPPAQGSTMQAPPAQPPQQQTTYPPPQPQSSYKASQSPNEPQANKPQIDTIQRGVDPTYHGTVHFCENIIQAYTSGLVNHLVNYEAVHKSMQPSHLYENGNDKLYFTDRQYRKGGFKRQDLCYHRKKRMKEIEMDEAGDRGNIMMP